MVQLSNERSLDGKLKASCVPLRAKERKATLRWAEKVCLSIDAWHLFAWIIDRVPHNHQWCTQMAAVVIANKMHHSIKGANKATIAKWKWRITPRRLCDEEVRVMTHLSWTLPTFALTDCIRGMSNVFPSMRLYDSMLNHATEVVQCNPRLPVVDICTACVRACLRDNSAIQFWNTYERGMRTWLP